MQTVLIRSFFHCCIKMKLAWRNRCNAMHHLSPVVNMHFSVEGLLCRKLCMCMALHFSSALLYGRCTFHRPLGVYWWKGDIH